MSELQFKIDGKNLKEGVPLHIAIAALDSFQKIVDKSYIGVTGIKRISPKDREKYYINTTEIKHGSLLTNFDIVLQATQLGLPLVSAYGPQNVWEATKDTFNFLKTVCGAVQKGEQPAYEFNNQGDATVRIGDTTHHYHGTVIQIGKLSLKNFQDLAHLAGEGKLDEISAGKPDSEKKDIFIASENANMFDIPTRFEQEIRSIKAEVFDFNKYKNAGKLAVSSPGQYIPEGEYHFSIFGSQDSVGYIYSMLEPEVELNCLIELETSPFGGEKIHKLHITGLPNTK